MNSKLNSYPPPDEVKDAMDEIDGERENYKDTLEQLKGFLENQKKDLDDLKSQVHIPYTSFGNNMLVLCVGVIGFTARWFQPASYNSVMFFVANISSTLSGLNKTSSNTPLHSLSIISPDLTHTSPTGQREARAGTPLYADGRPGIPSCQATN